MVKITKVYTKCGDRGKTTLAAGRDISKSALRIAVIGEIDELNAHMGFLLSEIVKYASLNYVKVAGIRIQNELFNLGAQIAVLKEDRRSNTPVIQYKNITLLEKEIDYMNADLPALSSFILPGGGSISTRIHIARTVCRRAERSLVGLFEESKSLDGTELPYLNRLSDWLFVAARFSTHTLGQEELLWTV